MANETPMKSRAVSCFVFHAFADSTKVLLLRRVGEPLDGEWCHIAGRLEGTEKAWEGAIREVKEETSLDLDRLYTANIVEQFYSDYVDAISVVPVFVGFVDTTPEIQLNHEHDTFKWMSLEEAREAFPFPSQGRTLKTVWEDFVLATPPERSLIFDGEKKQKLRF